MTDIEYALIDDAGFAEIPAPALPGARCQTCDYWERIDGGRAAPDPDAPDATARATLKRQRLLAGQSLSGAYGMLAHRTDAVERSAIGYAQFGPLSLYPRAQSIRDRYRDLPESPAPWIVTCLQVSAAVLDASQRAEIGTALLEAVCDELDRRGITAVEAYPEAADDAWGPSPGPASVYEAAGFERVAGDERFPVYRRELSGETDADAWSGLLQAAKPDEGDDWPLPLPSTPDADDFFRLPPAKPKRSNPFGDD
jgi:GNAT superfamily N-acetyltransferase